MNAFPVPFKIVIVVILTLLLMTIGVLNLRDRASYAEPTDGVFWTQAEDGLRAEKVTPDGPSAAAGINAGDRLIAINGSPVRNLDELTNQLDTLGLNAAATYTVVTKSGQREFVLQLAARILLGARDVLRTLLAFLYLGIGIFVVFKAIRLPRSMHFHLICLTAFVVFLYSYSPKLEALDWTVLALSVAAFLLLPALFIHFCLHFPVENAAIRARVPLIYAPALFLGIIHAAWMTGRLANAGLPTTPESLQLLDRIHMVYFITGFLAGGFILAARRKSAADHTARQQMKWVSYGTLAGIGPFGIIYGIPWLLGAGTSLAMEASMLFLAFIPLSFAYAVVHFRLADVDNIVRKGAAYFLASSLLLCVYLFFVLVVGRALQWLAPDADFFVICAAALAIALVFAPLRSRIQSRLDRMFYKDRFEERAGLLEFARTLSSEISLAPLSRSILDRVARTFQVTPTALFLAEPARAGYFRLANAIGFSPTDPMQQFRREDLLDGGGQGSPAGAEGPALSVPSAGMRALGLAGFQELKVRGNCIGWIGLGLPSRDRRLSSEDLALLAALSGYAAIALENASLYRAVETKALELEQMKSYTENILESINVAVLALDLGGQITSCNKTFEELYRVQRDQIRGLAVEKLLSEDVIQSIQGAAGTRGWDMRSGANIFKLHLTNRVQEKLIVDLSIIPLLEAPDQNSGCLIVMDNITDKVQLQDQMMQVEKLSSIGLLAAGIAHEVNTPITGISSFTQLLLKQTSDGDQRKPILEKIEKQTFRAAEIVNGLLNFARMNGSEFTDLDLNVLIRESLSLLDHQMRQSRVKVESSLDETIPPVYGNCGKLQQVFINLFLNARDAMGSGGDLKVRTAMNDEMVIVDIKDTGVGITEENIKRIYDPFFTTKRTGKGTGLGLAVTYGIIQEHGGRIFVESTPGSGTSFRLKLPTRHIPRR
jgi:two-component system, NtrC family, sensor kinase